MKSETESPGLVSIERRIAECRRPAGAFVMHQRWEELLFLHWSFPPGEIQRTLPAGLRVDTFEGRAWVGLVPFFMRGIRPRWLPGAPWISNFLELNLRTYAVDERGRPGVWFYSLDCNRAPAVWLGRTFFHLNYQRAEMSAALRTDGTMTYACRRRGADEAARFHWRLVGTSHTAEPGTLEFFLCERYRLFASNQRTGRIRSGRVHHAPYPLQQAEVTQWSDQTFALDGLPRPARAPDHMIGSRGVAVNVFPLERESREAQLVLNPAALPAQASFTSSRPSSTGRIPA